MLVHSLRVRGSRAHPRAREGAGSLYRPKPSRYRVAGHEECTCDPCDGASSEQPS